MITRIELKNFMSHEHTVIDPVCGLNVLVGPNNCGKSAVVAALQILCHNDNSTYVMRHGEKECSVHIETDDGHTIQWRRRKSPSYVIDGVEYGRLQQSGIPAELHRALRLPKVEAGNDTDFDVHFGCQKDPIFLLGNSSGNAAKFFASSSDAIRLVEMQKRHKEKLTEARSEKNRREQEAKQLTAELESLAPAVELQQRLVAAEHLHVEIQQLTLDIEAAQQLAVSLEHQDRAVALQREETEVLAPLAPPPELAPTESLGLLIDKIDRAQRARSSAQERAAALAALVPPPPQHDCEQLATWIDRAYQWQREAARSADQRSALMALASPPVMDDAAALASTIGRLERASRELAHSTARSAPLARMQPPPVLASPTELATLLERLALAAESRSRLEQVAAALTSLTLVPQPVETASLADCVNRLQSVQHSQQSCAAALREAEAELSAVEQQLREQAAQSVCPTCGGPWDADRLLAHSALGGGGHNHA